MRIFFHLVICSVLLWGLALAQDGDNLAPTSESLDGAWLGIGLTKPDEAMANQLPILPPGIGFVVTDLTKGGPAERAGVKKHDLLWKMNEQMLVNEGQLATLLRLASPGEKAMVSVFRDGDSKDIEVTLGNGEVDGKKCTRQRLSDTVLRQDDGAVKIVSTGIRKAVVKNENGSAEVSRVENGDAVSILNPNGEVIFEGVLRGRPDQSAVPDEWKKSICAMRRTLDHALSVKAAPERQPRPRIVPPVAEE